MAHQIQAGRAFCRHVSVRHCGRGSCDFRRVVKNLFKIFDILIHLSSGNGLQFTVTAFFAKAISLIPKVSFSLDELLSGDASSLGESGNCTQTVLSSADKNRNFEIGAI